MPREDRISIENIYPWIKVEVKDEPDFYDENNIIDHEICIKNELDDSDIQPFYFAL